MGLKTGLVCLESGAPVGWTAQECFTPREDRDLDGLDDGCELALTQAFAPVLLFQPGGCGWDESAQQPRPAGGYLYAVQRAGGGDQVRIAYLPAYFHDCGWSGPKCWFLPGQCKGHTGDSELIAVQVVPASGQRWRPEGLFLSAHCFRDPACRWYGSAELPGFHWELGGSRCSPVVWVAAGRNANYPSQAACDRGHRFFDTCDRDPRAVVFPILSGAQNIGSRQGPFLGRPASGCLDSASLPLASEGVGEGVQECFWGPEAFRGWQGSAIGHPPTPYEVYLRTILGF